MTNQVRRVVTGHDEQGRAVVMIDDLRVPGPSSAPRPGASSCLIWTTDSSPASNDGSFDGAERKVGTVCPGGTVFRLITYQPGVAPRVHRTNSVDYIVVLSGEIHMELDDGVEVHLRTGDVMVQRGTVHNWINRGSVPCTIACILVDARPVTAGGKVLEAKG